MLSTGAGDVLQVRGANDTAYQPIPLDPDASPNQTALYLSPGRIIQSVSPPDGPPALRVYTRTSNSTFTTSSPLANTGYGWTGNVYAAADDGTFMTWAYDSNNSLYRPYVFLPRAEGQYTAIELDFAYANLSPPTDAPGVWLGGTCWALNVRDDAGGYTTPTLWGCGNDVAVESIAVSYATTDRPTFTYDVLVDDTCKTDIVNTVSIATTTPESAYGDNAASATIGFAKADLEVVVAVDRGVVDPDATGTDKQVTYAVTVTNHGGARADDVHLSATFPVGIDAAAFADYDEALAEIAPGASVVRTIGPLNVTSTIAEDQLRASFNVGSADTDCDATNNAASALTIVSAAPNVWVTKTGPATVRIGETIHWVVTYGNNGNDVATEPSITDVWPGATEVYSELDDLGPGDQDSLDVYGLVDNCLLIGQSITNTATISADIDIDESDNSASASTLVLGPLAQLAVDIVPSRGEAVFGESLTYTIHIRNVGSGPSGPFSVVAGALGTVIMDPLTPAWEFAELLPGQATSVSFETDVAINTGTIIADAIIAPMPGGMTCGSSVTAPVVVVNDATTDPSGLVIVKSADTQTTCQTGTIRWTLEVSKRAWGTASDDVRVVDEVPAGIAYLANTITGRGADAGAYPTTLAWDVGHLEPGDHLTLSYLTTAPAGASGMLFNTAQIFAGQVAEGFSNPAEIRTDCQGTLEIDQSFGADCALELGDLNFITVNYKNAGTIPLANVVVRSYLGDDWFLEGSNAPGGFDHDDASGIYSGRIGTLAPGASGSFLITVSAWNLDDGNIGINRLTATADGMLPVTSNQQARGVGGCDDADPCTTDACIDGACTHTPIPNCGEPVACDDDNDCSDTDNNACTVAHCDAGTCVLIAGNAGTQCRASNGACDVAEVCNGTETACPPDGVADANTTCRAKAGFCDVAETCDGQSPSCPDDALDTVSLCRPAEGECDTAEYCSGAVDCPVDTFGGTQECRPANGPCDVAEACNGSGPTCPADGFALGGVCRASNGVCDVVESCDGTGAACPSDDFDTGTPCRPSEGLCDVAEVCDGEGATCPPDIKVAATTECRASAGVCDPAEQCNGSDADCPADTLHTQTVCRPSLGFCDPAEQCNGSDVDCPADLRDAQTLCRVSAGVCDSPETCDGVDPNCPQDAKLGSNTPCRSSAGVCDPAEQCDGEGVDCPVDTLDATSECRPSAGICDQPETCDGSGPGCPADTFKTTECRASAGDCDLAEVCTGSDAACPDDVLRSGTICRDSDGACDVAEVCDGINATCPGDGFVADGNDCADGDLCNGDETCLEGTCTAGLALDCDDDQFCNGVESCDPTLGCRPGASPALGDQIDCTVDSCDEANDLIQHVPNNALCDDLDLCTTDRCDPVTGCVADAFVSEQVQCGVGACETIIGNTTCDPAIGPSGDDCEELLPDDLSETCNAIDDDCDGDVDEGFDTDCGPGLVFYAIVEDERGQPVGTIRCFKNTTSGVLDCTHRSDDPLTPDIDESLYLEVFDGLLCPAVAP